LETKRYVPPFETFHPFEALRDSYEKDILLKDCNLKLTDLAEVRSVDSINSDEGIKSLRALNPDVMIVFGTGKLLAPAIEVASLVCMNLHGGNPEQYRGLDTHLWAIYHRDFKNLITTLHRIDSRIDTGDIILQSELKLGFDSKLYQLRAINTKVCIALSSLALSSLESTGSLPSRKQITSGRYYSWMPSMLKGDCLNKFEGHVEQL
jgi:methionyl-tRNA formyltransferase